MRHNISADELGPAGNLAVSAVQACVHCGFCLPTCPTYVELGQEMDTPRGRIILMKEALEGSLPIERTLPHIDRCLGCMACETSCPSGVEYRNLLGPFREKAESERQRNLGDKIRRKLLLAILPSPVRFRWAAKLGLLARPFAKILPKRLGLMLKLLPRRLPKAEALPRISSPIGAPRARVALLAGCAQQVIAPSINLDTIDVLVRNGVEVIIPEDQACCGALGWHVGLGDHARHFARKNLRAFPDEVDAIVTNAAGCGSGLCEYPLIMKGLPEEETAKRFAAKVVDFSEFLDKLGLEPPPATNGSPRIVYQDACHLRHAQGVVDAPRRLLRAIPGIIQMETADPASCCGSAGSYNINQPEIAASLGQRKVKNLLAENPDWIISGNIGCITQIQASLPNESKPPIVTHLVNFLRRAYEGKL